MNRPTPETDAFAANMSEEFIDPAWLKFSQELERERDVAKAEAARLDGAYEDATNYYERIIELIEERDEAREALANETNFHHRTHSELIEAQCNLMDATQAIITTLEENRHLADGEDCTLAKLKLVVSEWK